MLQKARDSFLCSYLMDWEHSSFFQNEGVFVQLDELDKLDKITYG